MKLSLINPPDSEPVTLEEAKNHLRVDINDDDNLIDAIIQSARRLVEVRLKRALITQTLQLALDSFTNPIQLASPPLQSVVSITYRTGDGWQTLPSSSYEVLTGTPGYVVPTHGNSFPTALGYESVRIVYQAGYGGPIDVPAPLKQAILLLVGNFYDNRSASDMSVPGSMALPFGVEALISSEDWGFI
jgi:uncharacterized phiE125 gp8 family phage protein